MAKRNARVVLDTFTKEHSPKMIEILTYFKKGTKSEILIRKLYEAEPMSRKDIVKKLLHGRNTNDYLKELDKLENCGIVDYVIHDETKHYYFDKSRYEKLKKAARLILDLKANQRN
jgi:hypothetical protein